MPMSRRLIWLVALAGLAWLFLRRGIRKPEPILDAPHEPEPADELRRRLAESRAQASDAREGGGVGEPPGVPPDLAEEIDARRRTVHEQARTAADEMRRSSSDG